MLDVQVQRSVKVDTTQTARLRIRIDLVHKSIVK